MDFVRVKPSERVYDRDAVLGRDATSVFPTEIAASAAADRSAAAEAIGGRTFITETELEAIKAERTGEPEASGSSSANDNRPLAVVLAENKQAKEDAFQAQWTQMKTGKNRPLDEDELEFLNGLQQREATAEEAWRSEQASELDAFQQAVKDRAQRSKSEPGASAPKAKSEPSLPKKKGVQNKPMRSTPVVRVIRKTSTVEDSEQIAKRQKSNIDSIQPTVTKADAVAETSGSALAALMGDYSDTSD